MTKADAEKRCRALSKAMSAYRKSRSLKLRDRIGGMWAELTSEGFRLVEQNAEFKPVEDPKAGTWRYWNPRPVESQEKQDCTTRALLFCEGGSYRKMRSMQDRESTDATGDPSSWNVDRVWMRILTRKGWSVTVLDRRIRRGRLAERLRGTTTKAYITHSGGHVAAVKDGVIYDAWPSAHGMVDWIISPGKEADVIEEKLRAYGARRVEVGPASGKRTVKA